MRIRSVKPEVAFHVELWELEKETGLPMRFAWVMLWCACDRDGRFAWEPRKLGAQILPYDGVDFSRVLDAWVTRGFVVKYACQGRDFGCIPSWKRHQIINNRERKSDIPDVSQGEVLDASITREARVDHACCKEGKGRERKGTSIFPPLAEQIYDAYPKKVGRTEALKAIEKALKLKSFDFLIEATASYAKARTGQDPKFTPHPASWFNAGHYDDDRSMWTPSRNPETKLKETQEDLQPPML